jgi:hypothetical protein
MWLAATMVVFEEPKLSMTLEKPTDLQLCLRQQQQKTLSTNKNHHRLSQTLLLLMLLLLLRGKTSAGATPRADNTASIGIARRLCHC